MTNPTPDQPTGMNKLRELDRILDSFYLGDEDKYTPEAWEKHRANAVAAIQQIVERCLPEKRKGDIRFGTRGERTFHESDYDQGCNYAIAQFRHNLQQAGLLRGDDV